MKLIMTAALGLSMLSGAVVFAQNTSTSSSTGSSDSGSMKSTKHSKKHHKKMSGSGDTASTGTSSTTK